ncbi:MAG TPA: pyridoxal phosphate-dependent aminotransferase, partial [Negativicutes bacterium]|nr:pyridoxal phosphate-dependent aminotransferase [Negativicutes bacterium]
MSLQVSNLFKDVKPSPMLQMFEASSKYKDLISLGIGEPDAHTAPDIVKAAMEAALQGYTHYPPVTGYQDLRQAICEYWGKKYGLEAGADDVIIGVGATQAIYMLLQAIVNPGDEVIVPDPCFTPYLQSIEYVYGKPVCVPVKEENEFNMTAELLEQYITPKTRIVMLNSPNNPTGAVISREEALKIAEVIKKHDLILISDEIYEAFLYEGEHVCMATLPGMKERTYTIGGFSKTYAMCGWRIGYAIGPKQIIDVAKIINIGTTMCMNSISQRAALYAIKNCEQQVKEMVEIYRKRVSYAADRINAIKGMSCIKPKGSFYIFANIKSTGMKSMKFGLSMLENAKVVTIPGISFGPNSDDYIRISCTIPIEQMAVAFDRMEKALN